MSLPPIDNAELAMRRLGLSKMILVATPDLIRAYGAPVCAPLDFLMAGIALPEIQAASRRKPPRG